MSQRVLLRFALKHGRWFSLWTPDGPLDRDEIEIMRRALDIMFEAIEPAPQDPPQADTSPEPVDPPVPQ